MVTQVLWVGVIALLVGIFSEVRVALRLRAHPLPPTPSRPRGGEEVRRGEVRRKRGKVREERRGKNSVRLTVDKTAGVWYTWVMTFIGRAYEVRGS